MTLSRRISRPVRVADKVIGGDAPILVQSMTNTDTEDAHATAEPAKIEASRSDPVPVAPRDGSVLRFRFSGESWVEVRDARGRVLMSGLNAPGSVAEVSGKPPLKVTVGNAAAVELQRDGRPFDLVPHTRETVARFSIE